MPNMTIGYIACIRRLDDSRFPNGNRQLRSAPFSSALLAGEWSEAFPDCVCLHINPVNVLSDSIVEDGIRDLPGGMSFVFDILNDQGSVVTTIVRETDNPFDVLDEYAAEVRVPPNTLTKMGWSAREL